MLEQVEQHVGPGWVEFIDTGALSREAGFNVLAHTAGRGCNSLLGKSTKT